MTKIILILFFLSLPLIGNSQTDKDTSIQKLISEFIKTQKIDIAFTYENYFVGGITIIDSASYQNGDKCIADITNHPVYIFWKDEKQTYFTKINYCYEYSKIILKNDDFWQIYLTNKTLIENEKIKPFEYITSENSKKIKHQISISHSSFQKLKIITNETIFEKSFDEFDLQKTDNMGSIKNINYHNNINLKSKLIVDELGKIVSEAEKNNKFIKIKSR